MVVDPALMWTRMFAAKQFNGLMRVVGAVSVFVIFALFRAMIRVGDDALAMLLTLPRNYLLATRD